MHAEDLAPARLFEQGRLAEAEAGYQRLAQLNPEQAQAWYALGLARAARGHYRDAVDAQRLAVNKSRDFAQAWCALALALRESAQTSEGLLAVRECLRLLPDYAGSWNLHGNLLQDAGRFEEAEQSYRQALELAPGYAGAWYNLAALLEKQGRHREAIDAYGRAYASKDGFAEALLARAELYVDAKDWERARADFEAATRLVGWAAEGYWGLARVAKAEHKKDEETLRLASYRRAVRSRDRAMTHDAEQGIEHPFPYEPGLPLPLSDSAQP